MNGEPTPGDTAPPGTASTDATQSLRVDFYVIEDGGGHARLTLACKLAEKAYLAQQSVLVWHTDPQELRSFDDMLWTFRDGSFVPHEALAPDALAPIQLTAGAAPQAPVDLIINLAADVPPCIAQSAPPITKRVIEIIDGDEGRRRAGRARFKAYRDLGVTPASHNVA
ncbi:MAG TPA: DNA polymerase III subunit chi [Steroidobacteraceae bacterium]